MAGHAVIWAAGFVELGVDLHERVAEGVDTPEWLRRATHRPVVRCERIGPLEVALGAVDVTIAAELRRDSEHEASLFFVSGEVAHDALGLVGGHAQRAVLRPGSDVILLLLGIDAGQLAERVAGICAPVRVDDVVVFVDHQHRGHIRDRIELGNDVFGVHEHRIGDPIAPGAHGLDVFVDGDGDHLEVVISEFFLECLPTWQIEEATSPRGERHQQSLLAPVVGEGASAAR